MSGLFIPTDGAVVQLLQWQVADRSGRHRGAVVG